MQEQEIPQKKKDDFTSHSELKKEVHEIKEKLNQLHTEKENWFKRREEFSQQIKQDIQRIKGALQERDKLSSTVREEKKKRDELNKAITEKIMAVEQISPASQKGDKSERRISADELRRQIQLLEKRVETEGLSFEKEKEIMKRINCLRKQYEEANRGHEEREKTRELSIEIVNLKKKSNEVHMEMQQNAKESQKKHEEMVTESKRIDELKKREKEAHEKFLELKKQFNCLNSQLKQLLPELDKFREGQKRAYFQKQKHFVEQKQKSMEDKARSIEEKLKSGKKLTMKDLIVFQGVKG